MMSPTRLGKPANILLVEDNPGDADLARDAFENSKIPCVLHVAVDGEDAMDFLYRRRKHAGAPAPDLILLDLNLPRKNGREVLAEVKADPGLRRIPVLVMTISCDAEDILSSYDLHANCYITKPVDLHQFRRVIKAIEDFWLGVAILPPEGARP